MDYYTNGKPKVKYKISKRLRPAVYYAKLIYGGYL